MKTYIAFFSLALLAPLSGTAGQSASPAAEWRPCQIGGADSVQHMAAQCLHMIVPEDRSHPQGRQIALHIARLKARATNPRPDPLFFLAGGPGQAATEAYVSEAAAFERLRQNHDIVLVDQRGTGQSHPLRCPGGDQEAMPEPSEQLRLLKACLAQLDADPRFYTTSVAVRDLDAVRQKLGYPSLDLYGVSYGTRVALHYLRRYPEHVRSVILDGVVPADMVIGPQVSLDAQQALDAIFKRCRDDADCHGAFPDLQADFAALQQTLTQHAVSVDLRDPVSGEPAQHRLDWQTAATALRLMSYGNETVAIMPLLIHQAAQRDYAPLLGDALLFRRQLNEGMDQGMSSSVLCTEDVRFYQDDAATERALKASYVGTMPVDVLKRGCKVWPVGVMDPHFKEPVVSDKPVLLISGEFDPITPPANAEHAAKTLSNSLSIVAPGQGHGNAMRGCIPRLIEQFVEAASVKPLDTGCVQDMRPLPFFTSFSGPTP